MTFQRPYQRPSNGLPTPTNALCLPTPYTPVRWKHAPGRWNDRVLPTGLWLVELFKKEAIARGISTTQIAAFSFPLAFLRILDMISANARPLRC